MRSDTGSKAAFRVTAVMALLMFPLGGQAGGGSTATVALEGEPSGIAGVNYGKVARNNYLQLNDKGQVAYWSALTGSGVGPGNGSALWRDSVLVARQGDATTMAGVNYGSFDPQTFRLNAGGQLGFSSETTGSGVSLYLNHAIWRDNEPVAVERAATSIPGLNYGWLYQGSRFTRTAKWFNNAGQVAYSSSLSGVDVTPGVDYIAIWRDQGMVARAGTPSPVSGVDYKEIDLDSVRINENGQVAYGALLTGRGVTADNNFAIWRDGQIVARTGDTTSIAGLKYLSFTTGTLTMNDLGQVVYGSILGGPGVSESNSGALWRDTVLVARQGDATSIPGVVYGSLNGLGTGGSAQINNRGQVAYGTELSGYGVSSDNDTAIWRDGTLIAREGERTPIPDLYLNYFSPDSIRINDTGVVVYRSGVSGLAATGGLDTAIWIDDGTDRLLVTRTGQPLAGGTVDTVGFGELNSLGQVAYAATLQDGRTGAFLYTPDLHWRWNRDGDLTDSDNWTLGLDPARPHDLYIDPSADVRVTLAAADRTVNSLTLGGGLGAAALDLAGGRLTAGDGVTIKPGAALSGSGIISGDIRNQGNLSGTGLSVVGALDNAGVVDGSVVVSGELNNSGRFLASGQVDGTLVNQETGEIQVGNGSSLRLNGTGGSNSGWIRNDGGSLRFDQELVNQVGGNMVVGDAVMQFAGGLLNRGSLGVISGTGDIQGRIDNRGGVVVSGNATGVFQNGFVNNGTVRVDAGSRVVFQGAVTGSGEYTGAGTLFFEDILAPGNSPALLGVEGDMWLGAGSTSVMEIGGRLAGAGYDAFDIGGELNLGGKLAISLFDPGSGVFVPRVGDVFDLFIAETVAGSFDNLLFPILDPGLHWDFAVLTDAVGTRDIVRLSVSSVPLPASVWLLVSGLLWLFGMARRRPER